MSKELVIRYWCDNKAAKHPPRTVEGDTLLVYSPEKEQVLEIEICDSCLSKISHVQMQELVNTYGREQTPDEVSLDLLCPVVGCKRSTEPFKDKAGRTRHLTRVHPEFDQEG